MGGESWPPGCRGEAILREPGIWQPGPTGGSAGREVRPPHVPTQAILWDTQGDPMSPRFRCAGALLLLAGPVSALHGQGVGLDRAPSRFALYDGIKLHYKSLGFGATAVVFVHCWSCDLTFWRSQVPAVDGRVRAIFLDLPGFGRSDKPDVAYTMDYFAGAVDAVLRAAGVERAVLVG